MHVRPRAAAALAAACLLFAPAPARAQTTNGNGSLRSMIPDLFRFGNCTAPLCLAGSLDENTHGNHFVGAAAAANTNVLDFLSNAVGVSLASIPISAASSGVTFTFVEGAPVRTASSAGPIFGERATTLGRNRLLVGTNVTAINFTTLRGRPLRDLHFNFTHEDTDPAGLGEPAFENDVISARVGLDLNLIATTAFLTYGLLDRIDLSVAVPYVYTTMRGGSTLQVNPFTGGTPHFFAGDNTDPVLRVATSVEGTASGIGDVSARLKVNLSQANLFSLSLLGDARLPTGDEENFLGAGSTSIRGLLIMSGQYGEFSPHANVGYLRRSGEASNNAFLATFGFDQMLSSWATMAAELITESQVGESALRLPGTIFFEEPYRRTVESTDIPNMRDNPINASLGMKFTTTNGVRLIVNGIFPMQRAGLQPDAIWTAGLEYTF